MKLYGIAEIAQALGIRPGTVSLWRHRGKLPEPDVELAMGPVWTEATILPWLAAKAREGYPEVQGARRVGAARKASPRSIHTPKRSKSA